MEFPSLRHYLMEYNRIFKSLDDIYRTTARQFNLSECTLWILYTLTLSDTPMTQKDLCAQMLQAKQSINSSLKKLEEEGFLTLDHVENNLKSKVIKLTEKGRMLAQNTSAKIIEAETRTFERMSTEERTLYYELLQKNMLLLKEEMQRMNH